MVKAYGVVEKNLDHNDKLKEVLKQGTLSVGYVGLAEALVALIGKHHGESKEAQELGSKNRVIS